MRCQSRIALAALLATMVLTWESAHAEYETIRQCDQIRNDLPVKVSRHHAGLFNAPGDSRPRQVLKFGTVLYGKEANERWLKVGDRNDEIGWMRFNDLACSQRAVRPADGPEPKFYVKTPPTARRPGTAGPPTINAYLSADATSCSDQNCRPLTRGTGYFIFDEASVSISGRAQRKRLLLGTHHLIEDATLLGWVDESDGYLWSNALGLRPGENLVIKEGPRAGEERAVCIYESLTDAAASHDRPCMAALVGGDRWFRYPLRVPILKLLKPGDVDDGVTVPAGPNIYKVALYAPGKGLNPQTAQEYGFEVRPDSMATHLRLDALEKLKNIDVFFVIDGTASMGPSIGEVRGHGQSAGVIQRIQQAFRDDASLAEATVRYGYLVYRDTSAGSREFEVLGLPNQCDKSGDGHFQEQLSHIVAQDIGNDNDFEENTFGGLKKALNEYLLPSCRKHLKVLVMIGDHGYNPAMQSARGRTPISSAEIATIIRPDTPGEKSVVPIFIQSRTTADQVNNREQYRVAYNRYREQARDILNQSRVNPDTYLMEVQTSDLGRQIVDRVISYISPAAITTVVADVLGGKSLVAAIEAARGGDSFRNVPAMFWEIVHEAGCRELGTQCTETIVDVSKVGYIPDSDDIVTDVSISQMDFQSWRKFLSNVASDYGTDAPDSEKRKIFVTAMIKQLGVLISRPDYDSSETFEQYLSRRGGVPVRRQSPLMNYKASDLINPSVVSECEFQQLPRWMRNVRDIFGHIGGEDKKHIFVPFKPYSGVCPTGHKVPGVDGAIRTSPWRSPDMGYGHVLGIGNGPPEMTFWIPMEFMP